MSDQLCVTSYQLTWKVSFWSWERRRPRLPAGKHHHERFSEGQWTGVGRKGRRGRLRSQDQKLTFQGN